MNKLSDKQRKYLLKILGLWVTDGFYTGFTEMMQKIIKSGEYTDGQRDILNTTISTAYKDWRKWH